MQLPAQLQTIGELAQHFGAHDRGAQRRQAAFGEFRETAIQPVADDEVQHGIAQKFQPLVVLVGDLGMLVEIRSMREGIAQEIGITKFW
jgi:hypothetical protein